MHQSMTCTCLKVKNIRRYSTVSKLVLLQPWQSFKTTFRMLDPNCCHFLCFPAVCQRTWNATSSTVCVKLMIQKYSGMLEVWKQTSHMIYPQQSWVTLLTAHPYLPSILLVLTITSCCHEIHNPHTWSTSAVFQQAQSIVCSLTVISDAAERSIVDITVQPVNYKEWSRDADTTSVCWRPQKTAAGHQQVDIESH